MSNVARYPCPMLPLGLTMFVLKSAVVSTVSFSSVVGSFWGERELYGAAFVRTWSLSASEKKIWVV